MRTNRLEIVNNYMEIIKRQDEKSKEMKGNALVGSRAVNGQERTSVPMRQLIVLISSL